MIAALSALGTTVLLMGVVLYVIGVIARFVTGSWEREFAAETLREPRPLGRKLYDFEEERLRRAYREVAHGKRAQRRCFLWPIDAAARARHEFITAFDRGGQR